ncbi:MAG: hypothetical protein LBE78_09790, partial [Burkholderiaceae bacterium]|nr:hypothetical protein [Burkholderiaceae bacterium]
MTVQQSNDKNLTDTAVIATRVAELAGNVGAADEQWVTASATPLATVTVTGNADDADPGAEIAVDTPPPTLILPYFLGSKWWHDTDTDDEVVGTWNHDFIGITRTDFY